MAPGNALKYLPYNKAIAPWGNDIDSTPDISLHLTPWSTFQAAPYTAHSMELRTKPTTNTAVACQP